MLSWLVPKQGNVLDTVSGSNLAVSVPVHRKTNKTPNHTTAEKTTVVCIKLLKMLYDLSH